MLPIDRAHGEWGAVLLELEHLSDLARALTRGAQSCTHIPLGLSWAFTSVRIPAAGTPELLIARMVDRRSESQVNAHDKFKAVPLTNPNLSRLL